MENCHGNCHSYLLVPCLKNESVGITKLRLQLLTVELKKTLEETSNGLFMNY